MEHPCAPTLSKLPKILGCLCTAFLSTFPSAFRLSVPNLKTQHNHYTLKRFLYYFASKCNPKRKLTVWMYICMYAKDEMVRQHHRIHGREVEQTPGDSEGQGSLACCSSCGLKELDMA